MANPSSRVFEYTMTVSQDHLDELQHVNNVVYVKFLQEAAGKHWRSVVPETMDDEVLWMVRRHEVDYLFPAVLHDRLIIRTWTGAHSAAIWDRHYEIIREADHKKIITAKTMWVLLDKATGRPRRVDEKILNRFA